jgi:hypothetical protein
VAEGRVCHDEDCELQQSSIRRQSQRRKIRGSGKRRSRRKLIAFSWL